MERRRGAPASLILVVQSNLALTYRALRQDDRALNMRQECYSGWLKLKGEEHIDTLLAANNYANILNDMQRHAEAKALLRKTMPVARRVVGG